MHTINHAKNFIRYALLLMWLVVGLLLSSSVQAQTDTDVQLTLQNVPIQDEKLLVVNLHLSNLTDLFGAEVKLRHDPAQLRVRDDNRRLDGIQISPGPLIAADDRFVVTNTATPESGQIEFAFTLLKPATPISGSGDLATVVFEIIGEGPYSVEVEQAQLVSAQLQAIPLTINNLYLNGALEPVTPAAGNGSAALWRWGATLGILGLLAALAVMIFWGLRWRPTPADAAPPLSRNTAGSGYTALGSAALLAQQGSNALKQDKLAQAEELFSRAIELDPANIEAWLGKGLMAQQATEKRICLQRVLALDPANQTARQELRNLHHPIG